MGHVGAGDLMKRIAITETWLKEEEMRGAPANILRNIWIGQPHSADMFASKTNKNKMREGKSNVTWLASPGTKQEFTPWHKPCSHSTQSIATSTSTWKKLKKLSKNAANLKGYIVTNEAASQLWPGRREICRELTTEPTKQPAPQNQPPPGPSKLSKLFHRWLGTATL